MPLGLARGQKCFVGVRRIAGFASVRCTLGVGKVWERVPATFPERTTLDLDNCIPYLELMRKAKTSQHKSRNKPTGPTYTQRPEKKARTRQTITAPVALQQVLLETLFR